MIRFLLSLLFSLSITSSLHAQMSERLYRQLPDSLKPANRQKVTVAEINAITTNWSIFDLRQKENELDSFLINALKLYKTINGKTKKYYYYFNIILYFYNRVPAEQYHDSVIMYTDQLIRETDSVKGLEEYTAMAYLINGNLQTDKNNFSIAYQRFRSGLALCIRLKDSNGISQCYNSFGDLYGKLTLHKKAISFLDSALAYLYTGNRGYDQIRFPQIVFLKISAYLWLFSENGKKKYADSVSSLLNEVRPGVVNNFFNARWYALNSELYYFQDHYGQSITYADSALRYQSSEDPIAVAIWSAYKGLSLLKTGKQKEGIALLQVISADSTIDISAKFYPSTGVILRELIDYNKQANHFAEALHYHEKLLLFYQKTLTLKYQGEIFGLEQKYNVAARDLEIAKLKGKEVRYMSLAAVIFILFACFILILFIRYRNNKRKTELLVSHINEQAELQMLRIGQVALEAKQEEQKRLGQDLHDGFSASLAGLLHLSRILQEEEKEKNRKKQLSLIIRELEYCYEKARSKSHEVYHNSSPDNFEQVLSDNIYLFFNNTGIKATVLIDQVQAALSNEVQIALFFIAKEAITNIIKHARASKVSVLLYEENDMLFLEIQDNGKGKAVRTDAHPYKIGLKSMKERAVKLGGSFSFFSDHNGVTITVTIPLTLVENQT